MPLDVRQIQNILRQRGSPMAREVPAIARVAQQEGVPLGYVLGIAGVESEFGKTGYARGRHNPYGYGIYSNMDWPSYAETTRNMLRGIKSKTYKGAQTPRSIAEIYAPSSDGNNPAGYSQKVQDIAKMFGYNISPTTDVIGAGAGTDLAPGDIPGNTPRGDNSTGIAAGMSKAQLLAAVMSMQSKDPADQLSGLLAVKQYREGGGQGAAQSGNITDPGAAVDDASVPAGMKYGGVDSDLAMKGGVGGNWAGSMPLALQLAKAVGLPITSQKRSRQRTASGGISDHWVGSTSSYAVDLGTSGAQGDAKWKAMMQYLARRYNKPDIRSTTPGAWRNMTLGGYRYNMGWEVPGHYDHIHAGIERV